jgi:hypothetical protein
MLPESEVFKEADALVRPLKMETIKIDAQDAVDIAAKLNREVYPQILPRRQIIILQNLEKGQLWNITLVGSSLDVLNVKISAEDGSLIVHGLSRLFDFKTNQ